jgi:hypothetical protein
MRLALSQVVAVGGTALFACSLQKPLNTSLDTFISTDHRVITQMFPCLADIKNSALFDMPCKIGIERGDSSTNDENPGNPFANRGEYQYHYPRDDIYPPPISNSCVSSFSLHLPREVPKLIGSPSVTKKSSPFTLSVESRSRIALAASTNENAVLDIDPVMKTRVRPQLYTARKLEHTGYQGSIARAVYTGSTDDSRKKHTFQASPHPGDLAR